MAEPRGRSGNAASVRARRREPGAHFARGSKEGPEKTVGVIARDDVEDLVEIAEPVGVTAAVTPVTNPTSTTIFKALMALKTRNPVVFAFHPSAQRCSAEAARVVRDAGVAAGAPEHRSA